MPTFKNQESHIKIWPTFLKKPVIITGDWVAALPLDKLAVQVTPHLPLWLSPRPWGQGQLPECLLSYSCPLWCYLQGLTSSFSIPSFSVAHLASWQPHWSRIRVHTLQRRKLPKGVQLLSGPLALRPSPSVLRVPPQGSIALGISGGCLEALVMQIAKGSSVLLGCLVHLSEVPGAGRELGSVSPALASAGSSRSSGL